MFCPIRTIAILQTFETAHLLRFCFGFFLQIRPCHYSQYTPSHFCLSLDCTLLYLTQLFSGEQSPNVMVCSGPAGLHIKLLLARRSLLLKVLEMTHDVGTTKRSYFQGIRPRCALRRPRRRSSVHQKADKPAEGSSDTRREPVAGPSRAQRTEPARSPRFGGADSSGTGSHFARSCVCTPASGTIVTNLDWADRW